MSKTNNNNLTKAYRIALIIILLLSIIFFIFAGIYISKPDSNDNLADDGSAVEWNGNQSLPKPTIGNSPAIEIPGLTEIVFIANQTNQEVNLYNPERNDCYFQMSLYVDDDLLWQSGNIAPGKGYYQINLNKPFKQDGEAEGYLKIRCFKKDKTELNSATVKFKAIIIKQGDKQ